tara:strand:- start:8162 stop:8320 length:159 start_codon:yes stop_codon:yes gene_type:complete
MNDERTIFYPKRKLHLNAKEAAKFILAASHGLECLDKFIAELPLPKSDLKKK